jgi:hypothetical protein
MSEKNSPIGTVKCPYTGCTETCNVFKFRKRAGEDKLTRFGGKLYAECPTHGRFGGDAREATQEYLLSHAKIPPKNGGAGEAPAPSPKKAPATSHQSSSQGASSSTSSRGEAPEPPVKRPWWAPVIS